MPLRDLSVKTGVRTSRGGRRAPSSDKTDTCFSWDKVLKESDVASIPSPTGRDGWAKYLGGTRPENEDSGCTTPSCPSLHTSVLVSQSCHWHSNSQTFTTAIKFSRSPISTLKVALLASHSYWAVYSDTTFKVTTQPRQITSKSTPRWTLPTRSHAHAQHIHPLMNEFRGSRWWALRTFP